MATRGEEYAGDGGGFVQLLEFGEVGFEMGDDFMYGSSSFSAGDPSRERLWSSTAFGDDAGNGIVGATPPQKSGVTGSDSSSTSSSSGRSTTFSRLRESEKGDDGKRRSAAEAGALSVSGATADSGSRKTNKKPKSTEPPLKVRKEKLGERITALQQLVSPFGKTDTASVLHEAMGYIRFLHEQVQVLSSPYLQRLPSSGSLPGEGHDDEPCKYDLRSRGLCLVPVASTVNVANNNGADFWSPAMGSHSSNR